MTKKTLYILGILLTILIGTWSQWKFCCKEKCCKPPELPFREFMLNGDGFKFKCRDNFRFPLNRFTPVLPVSDSVNFGIGLLKNSLNSNPSQKLVITGYCLRSEIFSPDSTKLGIERANALKTIFDSLGIPPSVIETKGRINNSLPYDKEFVYGPADFLIIRVEKTPEPLLLYFISGHSVINQEQEHLQRLSEMTVFLKKMSGAKLNITGHTDNVGSHHYNLKLGQARADNVKAWFMKNGVAETRIESLSKGPDEPVADNATAAGKALNRRCEISVKQ